MTTVRFAIVCDRCKTRGPEYEWGLTCYECYKDLCPECEPDFDEEPGAINVCSQCVGKD